MTAQISEYAANVWAVSPQDVEANRALVKRRDLSLNILSDARLDVASAWGVFDHDDPKGRSIPIPATYIINDSGFVAWRYIGKSTRDRPESDEILYQLAQLH